MFEKYHHYMTNGGFCNCEEQPRCSKIFVQDSTGRRPVCVGDCPADCDTRSVALALDGERLHPQHPECSDVLRAARCGCPDCHPISYTADRQVEKCSQTACPTTTSNGVTVSQRCLPISSKVSPSPNFKDTCDCIPVPIDIKDPVVIDVKPIEGKQ
jgi:hypothetical protein